MQLTAGQLTPLFGRQHERAQVSEMLGRDDVRLVTLTGPGGVGKSRLALQIAADAAAHYPDGVAFIPLASIANADLVLATAANALGLREAGATNLFDRLAQALHSQRTLLIFDNFEHVVNAATVLNDLLAACPRLDILTTSRVALRITGEREVAIDPLPTPGTEPAALVDIAGNPAVALFLRQAQATNPRFMLTNETAAAVAHICAKLDGLPLALELAAARIKVLTPLELSARLDRSLNVLTGGARDRPVRQKTMRDAIAWSHDLLSQDERTLFRRLAVFAGGWTLEAAEAVCADDLNVLDVLASLIDQSMVRTTDSGGTGRFIMLETIREFALEQLIASGEFETVKRRHADHHLAWIKDLQLALDGPDQLAAIEAVDRDRDNVRAALSWFADDGTAGAGKGLALAGSLWWFWQTRRPHEGRIWLNRFLRLAPDSPELLAARARALAVAGLLAGIQHEHVQADALDQEALAAARAAGDRLTEGRTLFFWSTSALRQGKLEEAREIAMDGLVATRDAHDRTFKACLITVLGLVQHRQGAADRAIATIEESLQLQRDAGHAWSVAWTLENLAPIVSASGDRARAIQLLLESATIYRRYGDGWWVAEAITRLIALLPGQIEPDLAARIAGAAEALRVAAGAPIPPRDAAAHERAITRLRTTLGAKQFQERYASGSALAPNAALDLVFSLQGAGPSASPPIGLRPAGLSEREIEVLKLAASGLTNAQIAEQLFLSPRTVGAHLQRIYDKIDVSTRAGATKFAIEHGLA